MKKIKKSVYVRNYLIGKQNKTAVRYLCSVKAKIGIYQNLSAIVIVLPLGSQWSRTN